MNLYKNDFFEINSENEKVYITIHKTGFPILEFSDIARTLPRMKINNFTLLKTVLNEENSENIEIGYLMPNMDIQIAKDKMTASLYVYDEEILAQNNREQFQLKVQQLLEENHIVYGIKEIDFNNITLRKPYIIAEGTPPRKGENAKVTYLEIPERKPVIREDGKADFFDMNFIYEIHQDDWLGEKIPPTAGIEGTNVLGKPIPTIPGKDIALKFDRNSAYLSEEDGKIVIRSKESGVVEKHKGVIRVNRHLPIDGNVGVETGNIRFDGSVTVKGTVQPGYSIIAGGDISIEATEGVTDAKLIKSINGDVYIRGGIFGLGRATVEAGGNIFVKHVNEANLTAQNDIVVGLYAIGSNLKANSIYVNDKMGKIIGGTAFAKKEIVTAIAGNQLERRTELIIDALNKEQINDMLQKKATELKGVKEEIDKLSSQIEKLIEVEHVLNEQQKEIFQKSKDLLQSKIDESNQLNEIIQYLLEKRKIAVEQVIHITEEAYPGTFIQFGKKSATLSKLTKGRFKIEFGELNV